MDFYIHFNTFVEKNTGTTNSILNWEKKMEMVNSKWEMWKSMV